MSRNQTPKTIRPRQVLPIEYHLEPRPKIVFPPAWLWLVDEALPNYVKKAYSPDPRWKDKPFAKEDVRFFSKGVIDLSEMFTIERGQDLPDYFSHPKYRSSYLLYFLPLHAAKFVSLFQLHRDAALAALEHGRKQGVLRIVDLGSGPGTASIAFLLWLLAEKLPAGESLPPVELEWFDTQKHIMEDGKKIAELLAESFPKLRGKLTVRTHIAEWRSAHRKLSGEVSLILAGNVLNETSNAFPGTKYLYKKKETLDDLKEDLPEEFKEEFEEIEPTRSRDNGPLGQFAELLKFARGGGVLLMEPATRGNAQGLSRLRDNLLIEKIIEGPESIWGPCLHAELCPLSEGRDWCHFSVPVLIPGNWFREFSKTLGSERLWAKFSYFWIAVGNAGIYPKNMRRVISDPLSDKNAPGSNVLICEPERAGRIGVSASALPYRGDLVRVKG